MPTTAAAGLPRPRASAGTAPVRGLLLAAVPVVGAAFALGAPAAAHPLYDTKRVLRHTENECLTLPRNECRTVRSPLVPLDAGGVTNVELACEPEFPYVVGWDAEHHEHISLTLASALPDCFAAGAAAAAAAVGSVALAENATICSSNLCNMSTTCCVQSRLMQQIQRRPAHRTAASAAQAATAPHATPGPPGAATEPAVRSTHEHRRPARPAPEIAAGCVSSRPATRATRAGASRAAPDPPRGAPPWSPPAYGSASTRVVAPRNPNRRRGPYCTPIRGFRSGAD